MLYDQHTINPFVPTAGRNIYVVTILAVQFYSVWAK